MKPMSNGKFLTPSVFSGTSCLGVELKLGKGDCQLWEVKVNRIIT